MIDVDAFVTDMCDCARNAARLSLVVDPHQDAARAKAAWIFWWGICSRELPSRTPGLELSALQTNQVWLATVAEAIPDLEVPAAPPTPPIRKVTPSPAPKPKSPSAVKVKVAPSRPARPRKTPKPLSEDEEAAYQRVRDEVQKNRMRRTKK